MSGIGQASTTETQVICTFASNTSVQCWVKAPSGVKDYASGDPSATAGIASRLGTFKVFAGRRSDPFFFNLQGFRDAVAAFKARAATISFDATGKCPNNLSDADVGGLRVLLVAQRPMNILEVPNCPSTEKDCFKAFRALAIVVQIDKTLLNAPNNNVIGVWASTHMGP